MVLRRFFKGQTLLTVGLMAAVLGGCGQTGNLYMPDQPPPHSQQQEDCRTPACAATLEPTPAEDTTTGKDEKAEPDIEETPE